MEGWGDYPEKSSMMSSRSPYREVPTDPDLFSVGFEGEKLENLLIKLKIREQCESRKGPKKYSSR